MRSATASALSAAAAVTIVVIAIPLAYFLVWRRSRLLRFVNLVTEIPYAVPGVVLAIAAILLFLKPIPLLGISIYNTVWIILFCYLARFLVLGLRPVVSGYHQLDRTLEEASQIAGARLARRLRTIILPLVAPTAAAGALLIFLTAFNELTLSALLWSSGSETLGVVFFSFQQGGDSTYAAALGVLTVAVSIALMLSTLLLAGTPAVRACFHGATDDRGSRASCTASSARSTTCRSTSTTASSSPSSARPAAARRRCCGRSPASTEPDAGRILHRRHASCRRRSVRCRRSSVASASCSSRMRCGRT